MSPLLRGRANPIGGASFPTRRTVAHVLAHQLTAIERDLDHPNLLLIDGVSNNLGTEDWDRQRLDAVYDYLLELGSEDEDRLQIIVADNTVPAIAADHLRVRLSEEDKLIPTHLLS